MKWALRVDLKANGAVSARVCGSQLRTPHIGVAYVIKFSWNVGNKPFLTCNEQNYCLNQLAVLMALQSTPAGPIARAATVDVWLVYLYRLS